MSCLSLRGQRSGMICIFLLVIFSLLMSVQALMCDPCLAESAPSVEQEIAFYQERTQEWEAIYGPHILWDYETNAAYAAAYGRMAGYDYETWIPTLPAEDAISYEEAVSIAKAVLHHQDVRITDAYLSELHIASEYHSEENNDIISSTGTWIILFVEETASGAYYRRCYAYVDAHDRSVSLAMIALDMIDQEDYEHVIIIDHPTS